MSKAAIGLLGFGEAGTAISSGWNREVIARLTAYDEKTGSPELRETMLARYRDNGVEGFEDHGGAFGSADAVFSLVFADRALDAATATSKSLADNALFIDGNSCSPKTKSDASKVIETAGGRYIDMAVMAPVYPLREKTPVLLSGAAAEDAAELLISLGMKPRVVGDKVGQASAIKLTRSVMVKGMEALFAEFLSAARVNGVEEEVIGSLIASDPDVKWTKRGSYALDRMTVHGKRRSAEMAEAARMLEELGLPNDMAAATTVWQKRLGDLGIKTEEIGDVLAKIRK